MIETNSQVNEQEIKRYLFLEMTDEERAALEEKFFESDELFFAAADLENELVDLYARKKLAGEDLTRFKRSLQELPERRAKVANAAALQTFIVEERPEEKPLPVPVGQTFWQKIAKRFTIATPAFGYAAAALTILFALSTVFLLFDNQRKSGEIASLQNNQQRQNELETQLTSVTERVNYLQSQTESQSKASDELLGEIEGIQQEKERIEKELEQLRKERDVVPIPRPTQPNAPMIASFLLTPSFGTRGGGAASSRNLSIKRDTKRIALRLVLPDDVKKEDKFTVKLNEREVASNVTVRVSTGGLKTVHLTISADDIIQGENKLSVVNAADLKVGNYNFNIQKK